MGNRPKPAKPVCQSLTNKPRAKSAIFLFMEGGPSHLDLFDPQTAVTQVGGATVACGFQTGHYADGRVQRAAVGRQA